MSRWVPREVGIALGTLGGGVLKSGGQAGTGTRCEFSGHSPEAGVCGEGMRGQVRKWGGVWSHISPTVRGVQREAGREGRGIEIEATEREMKKQTRPLRPRNRKEDKERDWEPPPPLLRSRDTQTRPHPSLVGWGRAEIPTNVLGPGQMSTSPSQPPCLRSLRSLLPSPSLFSWPQVHYLPACLLVTAQASPPSPSSVWRQW